MNWNERIWEVYYGNVKYRVDYIHPFTGEEFVGYWEGNWGRIDMEHFILDKGFDWQSRDAKDLERYRVEVYMGDDISEYRRTRAIYYFYKENPYEEPENKE